MKTITLLCAATKLEAQACRRGIESSGLKEVFEICLTGIGMASANRALGKRLDRKDLPKPARVISTGFAGASDPKITVGTWILGRNVGEAKSSGRIELNWQSFKTALNETNLLLNAVEVTSLEKVDAWDRKFSQVPRAVDMESFALAQTAQSHAIDFQIFRLVSDNPDAPIPEAIAHFAEKKPFEGMRSALRHPLVFTYFLMRASTLPKTLSQGWKAAAPALAQK